jgi:hypothetical protein
LLYLLDVNTPTVAWVFIGIVSVFGIGVTMSARAIGVQATASDSDLPTAAALYTFFRLFGMQQNFLLLRANSRVRMIFLMSQEF